MKTVLNTDRVIILLLGTLLMKDGSYYEGSFLNGEIIGRGVLKNVNLINSLIKGKWKFL